MVVPSQILSLSLELRYCAASSNRVFSLPLPLPLGNWQLVIDLVKDETVKTSTLIEHFAVRCHWQERANALRDLLLVYQGAHGRTIIFTETKKEANELALTAVLKQSAQVRCLCALCACPCVVVRVSMVLECMAVETGNRLPFPTLVRRRCLSVGFETNLMVWV